MNMISQLRQRVQQGTAQLSADEFDQLLKEWIVRAGAEEMVLAEREACAKTCEALWKKEADAAAEGRQSPRYHDAIECAYAIRQRGNEQVKEQA